MASKGVAIGISSLGVLFLWSGLRGASVTGSLKDLLEGKQPKTGANPIKGSGAAGVVDGGSGSGLASIMLRYQGITPYKWGGATPNGWDCSGAVNYCRNIIQGQPIPGYGPGQLSGHGPATMQWLLWSGAVSIPSNQVQEDDLICFQTHIGVAINSQQMISALDPAQGTVVTTFQGGAPFGEVMVVRRII